MRPALASAIAVLCLAALAGCSTTGAQKSGGPQPPTVLVLANDDSTGLDGAPAVQRFVDRVEAVSHGRLVVPVRNAWNRDGDEAALIRDVAAGRADLGWSGSRAFDRLGVASLRPLSAPYLVSDYAVEAAVVRHGQRRLLAGVGRSGVTPLALEADALRFPAAAERPLLAPDSWAGRSVRTVASRTQEEALSTLGARPVPGGDVIGLLESHAVDGAEVSWQGYVAAHVVNQAPFVTPDAPLWPRAVVLFAHPASMTRLAPEQRRWITDAAADSSRWSLTHAGASDAAMMRQACALGARIVAVTPAQRGRLRAATAPLVERLRRDPMTSGTMAWIEEVVRRVRPLGTGTGAACPAARGGGAASDPTAPLVAPGRTGALPLGTYRYSLTSQALVAQGVAVRDAEASAGVYTWVLGKGTFRVEFRPDRGSPTPAPCAGFIDVRGATVLFTRRENQRGGDCVPPGWSASWRVEEGRLVWKALHAYPSGYDDFAHWFTAPTWRRIG